MQSELQVNLKKSLTGNTRLNTSPRISGGSNHNSSFGWFEAQMPYQLFYTNIDLHPTFYRSSSTQVMKPKYSISHG